MRTIYEENNRTTDLAEEEGQESRVTLDPTERSVSHYESVSQLSEALKIFDSSTEERDWELKGFDVSTTVSEPNKVDDEARRLMVLKSYNILDTGKEDDFEIITQEAKSAFGCPIAIVSLVDLGRQWFKSIQGLPVESAPRCLAFCAHVVKQKDKRRIMVVPDATKDPRFKDNPFVTGALGIRFYAGAPLLTPEGERVGTLCIIDTKPRPNGMTATQQELLRGLAQEVVYHMITRDQS